MYRHPRVSGGPRQSRRRRIPAFAGMTSLSKGIPSQMTPTPKVANSASTLRDFRHSLDPRACQCPSPPNSQKRSLTPLALSPLGERVGRPGVFFSRGGPGEGVPATLRVVNDNAGQNTSLPSPPNQTPRAILSPSALPPLDPPPAHPLSRPCRGRGGDSSALDNLPAFPGQRPNKLA